MSDNTIMDEISRLASEVNYVHEEGMDEVNTQTLTSLCNYIEAELQDRRYREKEDE